MCVVIDGPWVGGWAECGCEYGCGGVDMSVGCGCESWGGGVDVSVGVRVGVWQCGRECGCMCVL